MPRRVVITGVGAVTPLGNGAQKLHERWCAGESGISDGLARCEDFAPGDVLPRKLVRRSDRFTQLALAAAAEAIEQAGWGEEDPPYDPDRVGCIVGTGIGGIGTLLGADEIRREQGDERVPPLSIPLMMANAAPAAVAMRHQLRGTVYGTVSACAAGAHAIGAAFSAVRHGEADAVVCGGAEAAHTDLAHAAFASMDALSTEGISRPFDARRDGFVMGEGAGILVLETLENAQARGATILGELLGYGSTADAHHLTAPDPDGAGAVRAIETALRDAGIGYDDVDYVNAHGTSTPLNDRSETNALKTALNGRAYEIPVSSTKSAIGHLLGAAGAVEAVATVIALRERTAPPTLNYEQPEQGLDLDYVADGPRELPENPVAISNSFGFGGHNAVLCLGGAA